MLFFFFFSSRRRHTIWPRDWSSDVCSSDLRAEVGGAARRHEGPGRACAVVVWWAEQEVAPFRILMPVVPCHVLVYHGPRRGMHGDVLDQALADHPDAAAVSERLAILAARSHRRLSYPKGPAPRMSTPALSSLTRSTLSKTPFLQSVSPAARNAPAAHPADTSSCSFS